MKRPKTSEKLFLNEIFLAGKRLLRAQRGLEIGGLIALVRTQLKMSQRVLAKRAGIPQSTLSRIESRSLEPNLSTLKRIVEAMECDLLITVVPRGDLETTIKKQARMKAEKKIRYLHGTMSLEKQSPSVKLLEELIDYEIKDLLDSSGSELWKEEP